MLGITTTINILLSTLCLWYFVSQTMNCVYLATAMVLLLSHCCCSHYTSRHSRYWHRYRQQAGSGKRGLTRLDRMPLNFGKRIMPLMPRNHDDGDRHRHPGASGSNVSLGLPRERPGVHWLKDTPDMQDVQEMLKQRAARQMSEVFRNKHKMREPQNNWQMLGMHGIRKKQDKRKVWNLNKHESSGKQYTGMDRQPESSITPRWILRSSCREHGAKWNRDNKKLVVLDRMPLSYGKRSPSHGPRGEMSMWLDDQLSQAVLPQDKYRHTVVAERGLIGAGPALHAKRTGKNISFRRIDDMKRRAAHKDGGHSAVPENGSHKPAVFSRTGHVSSRDRWQSRDAAFLISRLSDRPSHRPRALPQHRESMEEFQDVHDIASVSRDNPGIGPLTLETSWRSAPRLHNTKARIVGSTQRSRDKPWLKAMEEEYEPLKRLAMERGSRSHQQQRADDGSRRPKSVTRST